MECSSNFDIFCYPPPPPVNAATKKERIAIFLNRFFGKINHHLKCTGSHEEQPLAQPLKKA